MPVKSSSRYRAMRTVCTTALTILVLASTPAFIGRASGQDNEAEARSLVQSLGAFIYGMAWPTATYSASSLHSLSRARNGYDVTVRLAGTSGFSGENLWMDLVIELRNGSLSDVKVRRHNAILSPPFATSQRVAALVAAAAEHATADAAPARQPASDPVAATTSDPPSFEIGPLPLGPQVAGIYQDGNENWFRWADTYLAEIMPGYSRVIESVRYKPMSFYGKANAYLVEVSERGERGRYFIVVATGISGQPKTLLDGRGSSIYRFNEDIHLRLTNSAAASSYLRFFVSSMSSEEGLFSVLDSNTDVLSGSARQLLKIEPSTMSRSTGGMWTSSVDLLYGNRIYRANFDLASDGRVDMTSDVPRSAVINRSVVNSVADSRWYATARRR